MLQQWFVPFWKRHTMRIVGFNLNLKISEILSVKFEKSGPKREILTKLHQFSVLKQSLPLWDTTFYSATRPFNMGYFHRYFIQLPFFFNVIFFFKKSVSDFLFVTKLYWHFKKTCTYKKSWVTLTITFHFKKTWVTIKKLGLLTFSSKNLAIFRDNNSYIY